MRQIHEIKKSTAQQILVEALAVIQMLCSRGASLEAIYETAEAAIGKAKSRH